MDAMGGGWWRGIEGEKLGGKSEKKIDGLEREEKRRTEPRRKDLRESERPTPGPSRAHVK